MAGRAHLIQNPRAILGKAAVLGLVAAALAACGGGGGGSVSTPVTVAPQRLEDTFGTMFGVDYRAAPNTEAATVKLGDIIPVNPTAEATPLH